MTNPPSARSVKIADDERGGWSSDRPRPGNRPERPADLSTRCRVLKPADRLRYSPGSLVMVVSGSEDKVISPITGRKVAALYANGTFEEDSGRGHFLIMEEGAAQLAGRCADWIAKVTN